MTCVVSVNAAELTRTFHAFPFSPTGFTSGGHKPNLLRSRFSLCRDAVDVVEGCRAKNGRLSLRDAGSMTLLKEVRPLVDPPFSDGCDLKMWAFNPENDGGGVLKVRFLLSSIEPSALLWYTQQPPGAVRALPLCELIVLTRDG